MFNVNQPMKIQRPPCKETYVGRNTSPSCPSASIGAERGALVETPVPSASDPLTAALPPVTRIPTIPAPGGTKLGSSSSAEGKISVLYRPASGFLELPCASAARSELK